MKGVTPTAAGISLRRKANAQHFCMPSDNMAGDADTLLEAIDGSADISVAWGSEFILPPHLYFIPFHPRIDLNQVGKHLRTRHQLPIPWLAII